MVLTLVPLWVLIQVLLVVILRVVEILNWFNSSRDPIPPLWLERFRHLLNHCQVIIAMCENGGAVLCANIMSLFIHCGWIVDPIEESNDLS